MTIDLFPCTSVNGDIYTVTSVLPLFWISRFFCWYARKRSWGVLSFCVIVIFCRGALQVFARCFSFELDAEEGAVETAPRFHQQHELSIFLYQFGDVLAAVVAFLAWRPNNTRFDTAVAQTIILFLATALPLIVQIVSSNQNHVMWLSFGTFALLLVVECKRSRELALGLVYVTSLAIGVTVFPHHLFPATIAISWVFATMLLTFCEGNGWRRVCGYVKEVTTRRTCNEDEERKPCLKKEDEHETYMSTTRHNLERFRSINVRS